MLTRETTPLTREKAVHFFRDAAETAGAVVVEVSGFPEAFTYAVELCASRDAIPPTFAQDLEPPAGRQAENHDPIAFRKTLAAPGFTSHQLGMLIPRAREKDLSLLTGGLRGRTAGVEMGLSVADFGLASTGTLVIQSNSEDVRLAGMIGEIHVVILPAAKIRTDIPAIRNDLLAMMSMAPNYTALITGPNRTTDIERISSVGVHGPRELHILICGEYGCTARVA